MGVTDVRVAPELVRAALRYENKNFIARQILPAFPVTDEDGIFMKELAIVPFTNFANIDRGDHAVAPNIEEGTDSDNYQLEGFALRRFVSNREKRRAKGSFAVWLDRVGTRLEGLLQLRYEVAVAATVFAGGNFAAANKGDPGTKWDQAAADIVADIDAAKDNVNILGDLNAMAMNDKVFRTLRRSESLKEILGFNTIRGETKLLSQEEVKSALELEHLFVSKSKYLVDGTMTRIWGDNVLLFAVDPGNSFVTPVLGNSYVMGGDGFNNGIKGVQYPDAENRGGGGNWWEVEDMVDPIIYFASGETTVSQTGHLFTNVLT